MPASIAIHPRQSVASARRRQTSAATIVNVHAAKTHLSRLLERVERGERITIARAGRPIAIIAPVPSEKRPPLPPDDPLLNLDTFGFDGPGGTLTPAEIDRLVYGA